VKKGKAETQAISFYVANEVVTVAADDSAAITVHPNGGLVISEAGDTATFFTLLDSQPSATVTVGVSSADAGEAVASVSSLVFGIGNWNVAQTATITGVDDDVVDGDTTLNITFTVASSSDSNFDGTSAPVVTIDNLDGTHRFAAHSLTFSRNHAVFVC
jgi:hypothetical protein